MTDFDQTGQTVETQYNADQIIIGVSFEQYKADLAEKEKEIKALLIKEGINKEKKRNHKIELEKIQQQRLSERESYKAHISELRERIKRLDELKGKLPANIIEEAKQALSNGDNKKAEQLFTQIEEQADPHIAAAAEAAFQRGKLAEDAISYTEAYRHYLRATQLVPDNSTYLNSLGGISNTLGNYADAIEYYERALAAFKKCLGNDHPHTRLVADNLKDARTNAAVK